MKPLKDKVVKKVSQLSAKIQVYLAEKNFPPHVISQFAQFPSEEMESIFRLLLPYSLNQNTWAILLDQLHDVVLRDGKVGSVIIQNILEKIPSHYGSVEKMKALKEELHQLRYPRFSQKEKEFEEKIRLLKPPSFVKITHAPFFEDSSIEIKATLNSEMDREELAIFLKKAESFWR